MPSEDGVEIIPSLTLIPFKLHPHEDKIQILQRGRPKFILSTTGKGPGKLNHTFNATWYEVYPWLCSSAQLKKLFCWPCFLMRPETSSWCSTGVDDMRKFAHLAAKHATCKSHKKAIAEYDGTLLEIGLVPEFTKETSTGFKVETAGSDSDPDSEKLLPRKRLQATASDCASSTGAPTRETLTFHAWQQANRAARESADPKLARRRRRLAQIEVTNAELTTQKLLLEIQLLQAKIDLQRALHASVINEQDGENGST